MDDSVHHDPESGTYTTRYAAEDTRSPVQSVVEAVATATGSDPVALEPLYEAVNPAVVNRLVGHDRGQTHSAPDVSFRFEGCEVTVNADGRTVVVPGSGRP